MPVSDIEEMLRQIETGRAAEVRPTLEHLANLFPISATMHVLLARAHEAEGAMEPALGAWRWAATLMPNSPVIQEGVERCVRALSGTSGMAEHTVDAASADASSQEILVLPPPEEDEYVDLTEPPEDRSMVAGAESPRLKPVAGVLQGREPAPETAQEFEDLDRLIAELESARITPDPDFGSAPAPDLDDEIDDIVSETLARIYAAQRQYDEAARVYELLAAQQPERAREFMARAAEMRSLAAEE